VLVREFVAELRRVGSSTLAEMSEAGLALFKVPANRAELAAITEAARRLGYVEGHRSERAVGSAPGDPEWAPTVRGYSLRAPRALNVRHMSDSVLRAAGPTRKQIIDWFAVAAVVLGAALTLDSSERSEAVRFVSILVLVGVIVVHVQAEFALRRAACAWSRLQDPKFGEPEVWRFYRAGRIWLTVLLCVAALVTYALLILGQPRWAVLPGVAAIVLFGVLWTQWLRPLRRREKELLGRDWKHR
jgi:hypothetical protein